MRTGVLTCGRRGQEEQVFAQQGGRGPAHRRFCRWGPGSHSRLRGWNGKWADKELPPRSPSGRAPSRQKAFEGGVRVTGVRGPGATAQGVDQR